MKNMSFLYLTILLLFGCGSGNPQDPEPPPGAETYLSVNPADLTVLTGGGAQNVSVISTVNWVVSTDVGWLSCSPTSGVPGSGNVLVTAAPNYTQANRSAELTFTAGTISKKCMVSQAGEISLTVSPGEIAIPAGGSNQNNTVSVTANINWEVSSDAEWLSCSPTSGASGNRSVSIIAISNYDGTARSAELTFTAGAVSKKCTVHQETAPMPNYVPEGYTLVWHDEFNSGKMPDTNNNWWYETGASGWGNNELQNYVAGASGTDTCALVSNGTLKIIAKKKGAQVISIRMNTKESWTYGYFEARLKLPAGKGTWPAFWMLPQNFVSWPDDGEIDIMEEVGFDPNKVLASIHCKAYYHSIGTQKSGEIYIPTAQSDFHVYAVEWTSDFIKGYADGTCYFTFPNDKTGNKNTWPFNAPFYLKLNLAWGGDWGGAQGVDESKLPATYEIDYVRVFQKQ